MCVYVLACVCVSYRQGAADSQPSSAIKSCVADTMARKKDLGDKVAEALRQLGGDISAVKNRMVSLQEVREDAEKVKHLGVAETVADCEANVTAWNAELQDMQQKKVHNFPEDEPRMECVLEEVQQLSVDAKGIVRVLEKVREDRKAEETRAKSAAEYLVKKDVKKYIAMGVARKVGLCLVRLEAGATGNDGADKLDALPKIAADKWDPQTTSVHELSAFESGLSRMVGLYDEAAKAKAASLQKKMEGKDRRWSQTWAHSLCVVHVWLVRDSGHVLEEHNTFGTRVAFNTRWCSPRADKLRQLFRVARPHSQHIGLKCASCVWMRLLCVCVLCLCERVSMCMSICDMVA